MEKQNFVQIIKELSLFDTDEKSKICREVLEALPDWFGVPSAIDEYVENAAKEPFWAAFNNGTPVAFIALKEHNAHTAEIDVMGVMNEFQRNGIGKHLVDSVIEYVRNSGRKFLLVKTLDYSSTYEPYARTRAFYEAIGFLPLQVLDGYWDENNPCLLMGKYLEKSLKISAILVGNNISNEHGF